MSSPKTTVVASKLIERLSLDRTEFGVQVGPTLRSHLARLDSHRPLLIRDRVATDSSQISDELIDVLSNGTRCTVLDVGSPLAPAEVDRLGEICRDGKFDCIVAVGGGATLDAAKLIAICASNNAPIMSLLKGEFVANKTPIIAVPTTAGSGSEATHFAVLFVGVEKHSISHPSMRPKVAVIDPSLIASVPKKVAAAAGLDVLCQSIESLWSQCADGKSLAYASEALRLVVPSLHPAVMEANADAQSALCLASHLSGQAINRSYTTICHALSYTLTARYGVPHGMAAASTLPASLLFNSNYIVSDGSTSSRTSNVGRCIQELLTVFECDDVESIVRQLVLLIRSVGGAASVSELCLPLDYRPVEHAETFNPERLRNNPRHATPDDIISILLCTFDYDGYVKT